MPRKRRGGSMGRSTPDAKRVCGQRTAEEQHGAEADQTPVPRQERFYSILGSFIVSLSKRLFYCI